MPTEQTSMSAKEQEYVNGTRAFKVVLKDGREMEFVADHISFTPTGDLLVQRADERVVYAVYHTLWKEAFAVNVLTGEACAVERTTTPDEPKMEWKGIGLPQIGY